MRRVPDSRLPTVPGNGAQSGLERINPAPKTISATPPSMNSVSLSLSYPFAVYSLPVSIAHCQLPFHALGIRSVTGLLRSRIAVHQRLPPVLTASSTAASTGSLSPIGLPPAERLRLTADQQNVASATAHRCGHAQHVQRIHGVRFNWPAAHRRSDCVQVGLDHVQGPGCFAMRKRVHQDGGFVAVLSAYARSKPRMPKSTTRTLARRARGSEAVRDLDAEGVVAQKDVADAGDQNAGLCVRG